MKKKGCSLCERLKKSKVGFFMFGTYTFSLFIWGQIELIKYAWHFISKLW